MEAFSDGAESGEEALTTCTSLADFRLDGTPLEEHPAFQRHFRKLQSWNWNFGSSPQFSISFDKKFSWAFVVRPQQRRRYLPARPRRETRRSFLFVLGWRCSQDVGLNVQDGKVSQAKVFSDALSTELIEAFQEALPGRRISQIPLNNTRRSAKPSACAPDSRAVHCRSLHSQFKGSLSTPCYPASAGCPYTAAALHARISSLKGTREA